MIAEAVELLQLGFDETKIDEQSTLNIWIMILKEDGEKEVCFLECAGVVVGGKADEVVAHIERSSSQRLMIYRYCEIFH